MNIVEMILCLPFFFGAVILAIAGWEALQEALDHVRTEHRRRSWAQGRAKEDRDAMAR